MNRVAAIPGAGFAPDSLDVVPDVDRVVTTGRSMFFREERSTDVIRIWQLGENFDLNGAAVPALAALPVPQSRTTRPAVG